ncbi:methionine sulfoxide reductase [Tribonema minus]|uniref:peptide-methionine (S)-S-oxide reductase n=1 Tax=Tribonema minus TaxID=303371 RepID=A0A835Z6G6_9STRA|nr:methionine sulfoxide reductase [Tribonema minus]
MKLVRSRSVVAVAALATSEVVSRGSAFAVTPSSRGLRTLSQGRFTSINRRAIAAAVSLPTEPVRMLFGAFGKKTMDYTGLQGSAAEAAKAALDKKVPAKSEEGWDIATFAGGCFWGSELQFQRVPGVISTHVGYTQGKVDQPSYDDVCSGSTGHTEGFQVYYDPKQVSYKTLVEEFFSRVDPTQVNGQGNDRGTQYRSGVYFHTPEQEAAAKEVFERLAKENSRPIATELKAAAVFYPAEPYHQQYLSKGGRFNQPQSAEKGCTDKIRCYG